MWYGNQIYVIDWRESAINFYRSKGGITPEKFWQKDGITWNMITSSKVTFRLKPSNSEYSSGAPVLFLKDGEDAKVEQVCLCYLNSKISSELLKIINPTLNTSVGVALKLPFIIPDGYDEIIELFEENVKLSRDDWDLKEYSIDYKCNGIVDQALKNQIQLDEAFEYYLQLRQKSLLGLHKNEEEINRILIELYGYQEEIDPEIELSEITIMQEELIHSKKEGYDGESKLEIQSVGNLKFGKVPYAINRKEIASQLLSYSVGCMFGRFSLDRKGIILANLGQSYDDYFNLISKSKHECSFLPDSDNIIPMLDDEWFEDDIVGRLHDFLKVIFGEKGFNKNIEFIEEQITKDIRKYFTKDFYADHVSRFNKRPIYWMFSSPNGSFNALIYIHRYTPDTVSIILNKYLKEFIEKLKNRKDHLETVQVNGSSSEMSRAIKEKDKIDKILIELHEYERDILYPLATERIEIDLDDGVLVNYNKFGKAVKQVQGLNDPKTKEKVKKFDWIDTSQIR